MAASTKQPYPVESFTGGITDNLFGGDTNAGQVMQNFVIQPDGKLFSRAGSSVDDPANSPIPIGISRIGRLINYARNDKLFVQSARSLFYRGNSDQTGAWNTLVGPSGNQVLSAGTTSNYISVAEWNKQLFIVGDAFQQPMKVYKGRAGAYTVRNIGMPALASAPTVTPYLKATSPTYIYAFIYVYTYSTSSGGGTQTFIEEGPVTFVEVGASWEFPILSTITNIPVITNDSNSNYDTSYIEVQIYRTIANGTNLYLIATIPNGQTTYTDQLSNYAIPSSSLLAGEVQASPSDADNFLQTQPELYTNDGTLDYAPAPAAKYVHVIGNVGLYGYTNDAYGSHPYRIHQSVIGNPGFVPAITYVDLEDEVCGVNSVKSVPIALCKRIIYRFDGTFLSNGSGNLTPTKIHNSAGCISNESAVEAENYLFWAGVDGFYATDGFQVIKISDHLNTTYRAMLNASRDLLRIQGRFDDTNRRVYWTAQLNANSTEQDTIFCLDLRWGIKPNSTFTIFNGPSFRPTAIEVFNAKLYRGDANGCVYYHDPVFTTDPRVDLSKSVSNWATETIYWNYTSTQINFGSSFYRKFVSRILLQAENVGNTSIQITAVNDQGRRTRPLKAIRWRKNVAWDDTEVTWRSQDCSWNAQGLIEQWRRMPAQGLRLSYLQLSITNAYSIITTSYDNGPCVVDPILKTCYLPNLWDTRSVDYVIYLSNDNYSTGYPITAINGSFDTISITDLLGKLPAAGSYNWQLQGYQKGEALNLIGYTLHWENVDQNQNTFHAGDSGA